MKKKIDTKIKQKIGDSYLDWISVLKGKIIKVEEIIHSTNNSLEETFSLVSQLVEQMDYLSIKCKIKHDDRLSELLSLIFSKIKEIEIKNMEQDEELKEARKYIDKSISLLRSFYDKVTKDPLTGLWNKEYINNVLDILYEQVPIPEFTYIFIDLDNLKVINDTYGHTAGDILLKSFASYLKEIFGFERNYIARIQGDEFNIISFDNFSILNRKISKLKNWCQTHTIKIKDENGKYHKIGIEFSLGYSTSRESSTIAELVRTADKRMYKEKYSKKSCKLR